MSNIYKKLLRNKTLTAGDIYDYYAKDNLFKGIFSIHQKLPSLRKHQFIVLNLDFPKNGGTHWVCLYKLTSRNYFYFDAFGDDNIFTITMIENVSLYDGDNNVTDIDGNERLEDNKITED